MGEEGSIHRKDWIPELEGDGAPKMGIDWIHEKRRMVAS